MCSIWKTNVPLAGYTTFNVGGPAEYFVVVNNEGELESIIQEAHQNSLPVKILGGGSNVLVNDGGVTGLVIKNNLAGMRYEEQDEYVLLTAGSGLTFDEVVAETVNKGLWGLENLSGIPGTVGATPIQNVGAYGVEVCDLIVKVKVFNTKTESFLEFNNTECRFGYRSSFFKTKEGRDLIVTAVTYKLSKDPNPKFRYKDLINHFTDKKDITSKEVREIVLAIRRNKFPDWHKIGTAGSFFKNPIVTTTEAATLSELYPELPMFSAGKGKMKVALGYVLDKICGLRGHRDGNVGLYDQQALVMVNYGGATAEEVKDFAQKISNLVFEKTKIKIEWEVNKF